jgi:Baseplate J-like protein
MGIQYRCQNENRRQLVKDHPTLNGIDFLEVLDQEAPSGISRQQTLFVHLFKPVPTPFNRNNVQIEGGVRVSPIQVLWAYPATGLLSPPVTVLEQSFFSSHLGVAATHVLIVRTDATGDYSTYRLSLRTAADDAKPPPNFDLQLFALDFSFKVECPSEFDCEDVPVCPPERLLEPQIDYLAKDYSSFRRLMLDRLSILMPDWQERNPADMFVAAVEVLAYAGDHLSYYQDAVATESYLGTARQRVSVRRHARLLDYAMHEGCNARAWVTLEADANDVLLSALKPLELKVEAAAVFLTQVDLQRGALPFARQTAAIQSGAKVFEALHDLALYQSHNRLHFYTWGDEQCCLPQGATRATLKDDPANRLRLRVGDVLIFEAQFNPATGLEADRDVAQRQAIRLTQVRPEAGLTATGKRDSPSTLLTDTLTGQSYVEIEWHPDDALRFPLCLSAVINNTVVEDLSIGSGNVVLVDAGLTIREDLSPLPDRGRYAPLLQEPDIAYAVPYEDAKATQQSAVIALSQNPQKALPVAFLEAEGARWIARRDLLNSGRFASDFVVEREEDGRALLRFGDDKMGRSPVTGLRATYRVGNGTPGNVGAEAIAHLITNQSGILNVRNPLPAMGGTSPESLDQVRLYAPQAFRTQERAVTEADYGAIAQRHPAIQKAAATLRWTGSWHTMFVTVDRRGGLAVDADFETELRAFLEPYRLAGQDLEVDGPRYIPLDIAFTVCVEPGYFRAQVKRALLDTFSRFDFADGRQGFFHPDRFTFGQSLYLSQMVAAAMQVPGVRWVDTEDIPPKLNRFQRWGKPPNGERLAGVIKSDRLEILRLDNDPNAPENGKLEFFMEGGL